MGYITTVTLNNDHLYDLKHRITLGKELYEGVLRLSTEKPVELPQGITVVETHHADYAAAILVGGHKEATELGVSAHFRDKNVEETICRQLSDKLGFELRRKRKR